MSKKPQIDLGLAVSAMSLAPGEHRTLRDLAAFCCYDPVAKQWTSVSWQALSMIEQRALRKIRVKLKLWKDPEIRDAILSALERQSLTTYKCNKIDCRL